MNHKIVFIIVTLLWLGCLVGCGKQPIQDQRATDTEPAITDQAGERPTASSGQPEATRDGNPVDADQLFAECTLSGTVIEFSSDGCTISPTIQDGNVAYGAAPGYEDEFEQVRIIYGEACTFQISNVNIVSGSVEYDSASMKDVKKQTDLILYGAYDSEDNLVAERVYIYRSTED